MAIFLYIGLAKNRYDRLIDRELRAFYNAAGRRGAQYSGKSVTHQLFYPYGKTYAQTIGEQD